MAHVEAAKADGRWPMADGRWKGAYAGLATMTIPQDFLDALATMPVAEAFFRTLDRKSLFPIYYRHRWAKRPETRAEMLAQILAQLDPGVRFH